MGFWEASCAAATQYRRIAVSAHEEAVAREKLLKPSLVLIAVGLFMLLTSVVSAPLAGAQLGFLRPAPKSETETSVRPDKHSTEADIDREHAARRAIDLNDFYDPTNPDLKLLQRNNEATRNLPHDAVGFPDWMRALREGAINPRAGVRGTESMDVLDLDIVMRNTKEMPYVRFPHRSHTLWLACSNCHPTPFNPVAGANPISMADIFRGRFCGMCHDRVAFVTFFSCDRCHSVPQGVSGKR